MSNLENSPKWSAIVEAARGQRLPAVARAFGVNPGEIASALKRAGIYRTALSTTGSLDSPETEAPLPPEPEGAPVFVAPEIVELVADAPEAEVEPSVPVLAVVAEVTPPVEQAAPALVETADSAKAARGSRLDAFRALIGSIPDAAVAQQSGMSIQAVRNYRQKRGIHPAGRRRTPDEVGHVRLAVQPEVHAPLAPVSAGNRAATGGWGWRVGFSSAGTIVHRILIAESAAIAVNRLSNPALGDVVSVERLDEAL